MQRKGKNRKRGKPQGGTSRSTQRKREDQSSGKFKDQKRKVCQKGERGGKQAKITERKYLL